MCSKYNRDLSFIAPALKPSRLSACQQEVHILNVVLNQSALQVLLLDEVTVDMDVVARLDLLEFFR